MMTIAVGMMIAGGALVWIFGGSMMRIFTDDPDAKKFQSSVEIPFRETT